MTRRSWTLDLCLALPIALATGLGLPGAALAQDVPLEKRLAEMRAEAEAQIEKIRPEVLELLRDHVRAVTVRDVRAAEKIASRITSAGPGVRRVLIEKLDPGAAPSSTLIELADSALSVLSELPLAAGLAELRVMSDEGSALGRLNALQALGFAEFADTVDGYLARRVRRDGAPEERAEALASLARLGGGVAKLSLGEALASDVSELRARALEGLVEFGWSGFGDDLGRLVSAPARAREHGLAVIRYFELQPRELELGTVRLMLEAAIDKAPDPDPILLLERIGDLEPELSDIEDLVEKLSKRGGAECTEAAWVLGARLGSRESLKRLEEVYDFWVERRDQGDHMPYLKRARMYLRLRETNKAIEDYKDALREAEKSDRLSRGDLRVVLIETARAYALAGNLQRAGGALEDALLTQEQKLELAADPLFAELLAHPRHGRVLQEQ